MVSSTGICERCYNEILVIREDPVLLKRRLGELNKSENGIVQALRQEMILKTNQSAPSRSLNLNRLMDERDRRRTISAKERENIARVIHASSEELSEARDTSPILIPFGNVNAELIRYLANKPEDFHKLHPRKFEEVICEIFKDQGHSVELTPETRDGGRDLVVVMTTALGPMLVVVECKRWSAKNPVGSAIVERFLFHIRDKARANCGLIVATTRFTAGAIKAAQDYNYLLQLSDLDVVTEMAKNYGTWKKHDKSQIWIPKY